MANGRVAVAISGGGYRAGAWGLGVAWALVDAGVNADVSMVSSVSGGSITNAALGLGPDYCSIGPDEFSSRARPHVVRLAGRPAAWRWSLVATLCGWATAWVMVGLGQGSLTVVAVSLSLSAGVVGAAISGDLVFNRVELWLFIDLLMGLVGVAVWAWPNPWLFAGSVILLGTVGLFRGVVVGWCLGRSLRLLCPGRDHTLAGLNPEPLHVFLATELRAGHHAAFARSFVYCHDLGLGSKPSLPVRVAVQASSNLPGAFPTRWVRTSGMDLRGGGHKASWLALSDGGDYDNMGDQWPLGLVDRIDRLRRQRELADHGRATATLDDWESRVATFVIVANASGALGFRRVWKGALPVVGELLGLLQVKDILYDNGNSVRRQRLIDWFDDAEPAGMLVHIGTSPYLLARRWHDQERATEAIEWLNSQLTESQWDELVAVARGVGTQFWPLGRIAAEAVVLAAYAQTMVNLHLKLGTGLHDLPTLG